MSQITPPHATLGAIFLGMGLSSAFYGVTCLQVCHYFRRYKRDPSPLKVAVIAVWALESLNTALAVHGICHYTVRNKGNFAALADIVWSLSLPPGINGLSATIIQCFFAWRVYVMSDRNYFLLALIYALSISQFVLSLSCTIDGLLFSKVMSIDLHTRVATASFATTAFADILITGSICYYLYIKKTGHPRTNGLVNAVMVLAINNGVLSSAIALVGFISKLIIPDTLVPFASCFVLGKAYANSLMSSLNAREALRSQGLAIVSPESAIGSRFSVLNLAIHPMDVQKCKSR